MEETLNMSHERIVEEYLSEFLNGSIVTDEELDDFLTQCMASCPNSPSSPTMSFDMYHRISLTLRGYPAPARHCTRGRKRKSSGA